MSEFRLLAERHVIPTPAGVFYAVASDSKDLARQLLFSLMDSGNSQMLTMAFILESTGLDSEQEALELLHRMQSLGWLQAIDEPVDAPEGMLEDTLPEFLSVLSASGKALLADQQGFYLATYGFSHEAAEELSALSADVASMHKRHSGLLRHNLGLDSSAWAVVDAGGDNYLGFWPLYIGEHRFSLVIGGVPQLAQSAFTNLVWSLSMRYRGVSSDDREVSAM